VLRRETAHRGGKTVLVVDGFGEQHASADIEALAKRLRAACGCGGTVRERAMELQGDFSGKVRQLLEAEGFSVAGVR
jgi:translation initiation factor 1